MLIQLFHDNGLMRMRTLRLFVPPVYQICDIEFERTTYVTRALKTVLNAEVCRSCKLLQEASSPKESFHFSLRLSSNPYKLYVYVYVCMHVCKDG